MSIRIVSWNVNGLRAVIRKEALKDLVKLDADVYCFQEVKAHQKDLDVDKILEELSCKYYSINDTESKKGYSGVAVFSKLPIDLVRKEFGKKEFDHEGRILIFEVAGISIYNIYFPNGKKNKERLDYKLDFTRACLDKVKAKSKTIVLGDFNTAYAEIDLARPKENSKVSGFLIEERAVLDEFLKAGFVDSFRLLNPDAKERYSWWDVITKARERNVGWRIDYIYTSKDLASKIKVADIADSVYGSDHAPVYVDLD